MRSARLPQRPRAGFVLLEVIVSIAIMGIALSMVLRSFTGSLQAARLSERVSIASMLARSLIEQWELDPEKIEKSEKPESFKEYPEYSYTAQYEMVEIDYDDVNELEEGRPAYMRRISLSIAYKPKNPNLPPKRLLLVETALSASERFTDAGRIQNDIELDQ